MTPADPPLPDRVPFRVDLHPERDIVRVVPVGELDLATAPELQAQLVELHAAGFQRIVLDLRELRFIDSTGIRAVISEHRRAAAHGRDLTLIPGGPPVRRALEVSGLMDLLSVEPA